jgi:AcrR family transcriptional regulator
LLHISIGVLSLEHWSSRSVTILDSVVVDIVESNVWLRPAREPQRGAPPLSRDRIVAEAVALLDEEGVGRLTMRRLAERLGSGATTLYWHVKTKDDVLDLALDRIFGEAAIPESGEGRDEGVGEGSGDRGWREDITALLGAWRAVLLRHPWSATLLNRPLLGPNVLARSEFLYATLLAAGFGEPHLGAAAYALANYVIGSALVQISSRTPGAEAEERATRAHLRAHADRYPTLAAHGPLAAGEWDTSFTLGLGYLLDGIQAQAANAA